jgi:hypothetical protein
MRQSNHFPLVVEVDEELHWDGTDWAEIVLRKALDSINVGYRPTHWYTIVPMDEAVNISRQPVQQFKIVMERWN